MAQKLGALAICPEGLDYIPRTLVAALNSK